ncbi:hypothetical protein Hanom_Chr13g01213671 [Helianthus anomalus]
MGWRACNGGASLHTPLSGWILWKMMSIYVCICVFVSVRPCVLVQSERRGSQIDEDKEKKIIVRVFVL